MKESLSPPLIGGRATPWWRKPGCLLSALITAVVVSLIVFSIVVGIATLNDRVAHDELDMQALIRRDLPLGSSAAKMQTFVSSPDMGAFAVRHGFNALGLDTTAVPPPIRSATASTYDPDMQRFLSIAFYFDATRHLRRVVVSEEGHYIGGPGL